MSDKVEYYMVRNWDRFQHYSKRNPPWFKLYNSILSDYDFRSLSDRSKLVLLLVWALASLTKNKITSDTAQLRALLGLKGRSISLKELIDNNYLIPYDASKALSSRKQYPEPIGATESETESESKKKQTDPFGFAEFWEAYPRKEDRKKAVIAWGKTKVCDHPKIMKALELFKKSEQWQTKKYIPLPSTWLNKERYNDELDVPKESATGPRIDPRNQWRDPETGKIWNRIDLEDLCCTEYQSEETKKLICRAREDCLQWDWSL